MHVNACLDHDLLERSARIATSVARYVVHHTPQGLMRRNGDDDCAVRLDSRARGTQDVRVIGRVLDDVAQQCDVESVDKRDARRPLAHEWSTSAITGVSEPGEMHIQTAHEHAGPLE